MKEFVSSVFKSCIKKKNNNKENTFCFVIKEAGVDERFTQRRAKGQRG